MDTVAIEGIVQNTFFEHFNEIGNDAGHLLVVGALDGNAFEDTVSPRGRGGARHDLLTSLEVVYYSASTIKVLVETYLRLKAEGRLDHFEEEAKAAFERIAAVWPPVVSVIRRKLQLILQAVKSRDWS